MRRPLFIEVDLVQAEWVVTAYYSRDAMMIEVVEKGLDPHVRTGELISGAPPQLIQLESEIVGHTTDPTDIAELRRELPVLWDGKQTTSYFFPRTMSIRQAGKKANHGLNYNMGYRRFAFENEMDESDAKRCYNSYHRAYTGIHRMHKMVEEKLRKDRTMETCLGEKCVIYDELNQKTLDMAFAFVPQATVGRVTNIGLRRIYDCWSPYLKHVDPLANVHDSLLVQTLTRIDGLQIILHELDIAMTVPLEYHGRKFTLAREFSIGPDWGHMIPLKDITLGSIEQAWDALPKPI